MKDSLEIGNAKRTDLHFKGWTGFNPIAESLDFFGGQTAGTEITPAIYQAFKTELVLTIDPTLTDPAREPDGHHNGWSGISCHSKDDDPQSPGLADVRFTAFQNRKLGLCMMVFHVHGDLLKIMGVTIS